MNSLNTCKQAPHGGLAAWFRLVIAQARTRILGPCSRNGANYGGSLCADGKAVGGVLHVGAGDDGSVFEQQRGSHAEAGVGRVRLAGGIGRRPGQLRHLST